MKYKYELDITNQFKRDLKTAIKRGFNMDLMDKVVDMLRKGEQLPERYRDHAMSGKWKEYRDCHILPDWVKCRCRHLSQYADISLMPTN